MRAGNRIRNIVVRQDKFIYTYFFVGFQALRNKCGTLHWNDETSFRVRKTKTYDHTRGGDVNRCWSLTHSLGWLDVSRVSSRNEFLLRTSGQLLRNMVHVLVTTVLHFP